MFTAPLGRLQAVSKKSDYTNKLLMQIASSEEVLISELRISAVSNDATFCILHATLSQCKDVVFCQDLLIYQKSD